MVVGPLTKEEITARRRRRSRPGCPVPTLALNSAGTPPGTAAPAFLYQFALDPEQEARAVARRIATMAGCAASRCSRTTPGANALHDAFVQELQAAGSRHR